MLLLDFSSSEPEIRPYDSSAFNSTSIREQTNYTMNGNIHPIDPNILTNQRHDPLTVEVRTLSTDHTVGSTLELECRVRGMYTTINWFFNSDTPLVSDNRHYRILHNNTLIVYDLTTNDSGDYRC
ncbi:unnamed protein product, partial [Medioppia subpectinata]